MKPRICVSILPKTTPELKHSLRHAEILSADLVEVRLDRLRDRVDHRDFDGHDVRRIPLIASNRKPFDADDSKQENQRLDSLFDAVEAGFDYVDVDLSTGDLANVIEKFRRENAKTILSAHDYAKTPSRPELDSILATISSYKPDICKLVTTAQAAADNLTILNTLEEHREPIPLVCLAMGRLGLWSRILAPFHGAPFTYASLGSGAETAPGQPTVSDLRQIYAVLGEG